MLLSCSLIYKHSFSPHSYFTWNNHNITYKNRYLFYKGWFDNYILLVQQLFNSSSTLLSYTEFLSSFEFPVTPEEFAVVMDAIPSGVIMLFRNTSYSVVELPSLDPSSTAVGKICFPPFKKNNRGIRSLFQKDITSIPTAVSFWNSRLGNLRWRSIWGLFNKFLLRNKIIEISFKIIHRYYPTNVYLTRFNSDIETNCSFCGLYPEDLFHLFWDCEYVHVQTFWVDVCQFMDQYINVDYTF